MVGVAVTESDAKQRWCPFAASRSVRYTERSWLVVAGPEANKDDDTPAMLCLGDGCMAWRWSPSRYSASMIAAQPGISDAMMSEIPSGYCGLAGKP